jgi:hypothetical protein
MAIIPPERSKGRLHGVVPALSAGDAVDVVPHPLARRPELRDQLLRKGEVFARVTEEELGSA